MTTLALIATRKGLFKINQDRKIEEVAGTKRCAPVGFWFCDSRSPERP